MPYAIREMVGDAVAELPEDVVSILTYILGQLIRLPGIISSEVSILSLVSPIREGIDGLPEDSTRMSCPRVYVRIETTSSTASPTISLLGQLIRLPGIISSEISILSLVSSIREGIDGLPEDSTLAVKAGHALSRIIFDRDKIFIKSDWFKGRAVEVLRISQVVLVSE